MGYGNVLATKGIELISRLVAGEAGSEPTGHGHGYYDEQVDVQELGILQLNPFGDHFSTKLAWKSPSDEAKEYNRVIVVNWISEYSALRNRSQIPPGVRTGKCTNMYLKQLKLVTSAARPSLMTSRTQLMSGV